MKISQALTPATHEFACHSKACAPPPAGKGGSSKGSGPMNPQARAAAFKKAKAKFDATLPEHKKKVAAGRKSDAEQRSVREYERMIKDRNRLL